MFRKIAIVLMSLVLCVTTLGCGAPPNPEAQQRDFSSPTPSASSQLPGGQYSVQQATYDDVSGEYSLFLLNTPAGTPSVFRTTDLPMARLTEAEITAGQKSYLNVENNQPSLHLAEDFKIEYVHNVTETRNDPQTGQPQTVVVRRETGFWAPFAGALAGQAIGSLLFTPQYYFPPVYRPGVVLTGYGGYGRTYGQAVEHYQSRYQAPPPSVRNRTAFRTTGRIRTPGTSRPTTVRRSPQPSTRDRATGSGYGSSTLRQSGRSTPSRVNRGSGSFGSGARRSGSRPRSRGRR